MEPAPSDLAADTCVTRLESCPGWYVADLPDRWSYLTPSGGVLMTIAMRAMKDELGDPGMRPLSATTVFCAPVPAGPLEIRVEVLRRGRLAAQLRAALGSTSAPGPGLEVTATFARDREAPEFLEAQMPEVPRPEDADPVFTDSAAKRAFFYNFELRMAFGACWWEQERVWTPGAPARYARWIRYLVPQRLQDSLLDPLALPPIADMMPPAIHEKLGPQGPRIHAPSLDLTVHFLEDTRAEWFLIHGRSKRAMRGYATADIEIWDDRARLLAVATQTMLLKEISRPLR